MKHTQWMDIAAREYLRIITLLLDLDEREWAAPTCCPGWTVRDMAAHLAGAASAMASLPEQVRQQCLGILRRSGADQMTAVNARQISERRDLSTTELIADLKQASRRGIAARSHFPGTATWPRLPLPAPLGISSLANLYGAVYTRDAWMHRLDICAATGREPVLSADHDGLMVADLVLASGADAPRGLRLTGVAGGSFGHDDKAPAVDAIAFSRALAGRGTVPGVKAATWLF